MSTWSWRDSATKRTLIWWPSMENLLGCLSDDGSSNPIIKIGSRHQNKNTWARWTWGITSVPRSNCESECDALWILGSPILRLSLIPQEKSNYDNEPWTWQLCARRSPGHPRSHFWCSSAAPSWFILSQQLVPAESLILSCLPAPLSCFNSGSWLHCFPCGRSGLVRCLTQQPHP